MSTTVQRRIEALEARESVKEIVTIIRIIAMPGQLDAEPFSAEVRNGQNIKRMDHETADAFLARVEAEAKVAAMPGCVAVALVWPQMSSD